MKKIIFILSLTFIFATTGYSQDMKMEYWDSNRDGILSEEEFTSSFLEKYSVDKDDVDDNKIDDEDFYLTTFSVIDANKDNTLSEGEFNWGREYFYNDYTRSDFDLYDMDNDGLISSSEYFDVMYDTDFFLAWDKNRDTFIDKKELASGVFKQWDLDGNNYINAEEFNSFNRYYLNYFGAK